MNSAVDAVERLRAQFREASDHDSEQIADPAQAQAIIADLLQVGLDDMALRQRAAKTVAFWSDRYHGAAEMTTAALADKEAAAAQQLQEAEQRLAAQAQRQLEVNQAIERAMLAAAVHKLQNNPRQQTIGQLSKWQSEVARLETEVAEQQEQALTRLAALGGEE